MSYIDITYIEISLHIWDVQKKNIYIYIIETEEVVTNTWIVQ